MESSTGVGLGGLGPPPVFGRFASDNFPLATIDHHSLLVKFKDKKIIQQ